MLVTRREAEPLLGYASGSLKAVMQQQRGRWPEPVACQANHPRALLWDLDELLAAAAPGQAPTSRRVSGADGGGLMTCLECGRRYRSLGPHLARAHQMTATEYREQHRLPATTALMATDVRASLSKTRRAAMEDDPELVARMRAATPPGEELARRSAEARAGTDDLAAVRAARGAAGQRNIRQAQAVRRDRLERAARDAGFSSMSAAIDATRDLTARVAADRIGVGATTVKRWRHHLRTTPTA